MEDKASKFSVQQLFTNLFKKAVSTFKERALLLVLVGLVGGLLGLTYSLWRHTKYQAEITFLVEENKAGGGLLSSLGSQIGIDVSSMAGAGNSVISGDNMLELLKSKSMMQECLLTPFQKDSNYLLADFQIKILQ